MRPRFLLDVGFLGALGCTSGQGRLSPHKGFGSGGIRLKTDDRSKQARIRGLNKVLKGLNKALTGRIEALAGP